MALAVQPIGNSLVLPHLVLAHGFTQNAQCWGEFGRLVGRFRGALAIDAPGHGDSGHAEADLTEAGRLLLDAGGPGHYIGYSMGGRMLLHGALADSNAAIKSLLLIGATAGIEDAGERAARAGADARLAESIRSQGTESFIDEWLAGPLFDGLTPDQTCRTARLGNAAEGMAQSLEHCGTGVQMPLWSRVSEIDVPVLVLAGAADTKFSALGQRLADEIGDNARFQSIHGGHAVHLENPADTVHTVLRWLEEQS